MTLWHAVPLVGFIRLITGGHVWSYSAQAVLIQTYGNFEPGYVGLVTFFRSLDVLPQHQPHLGVCTLELGDQESRGLDY